MVVTAPNHRFAGADYVPVSAIADEHLFTYRSLASASSVVRDILSESDVQPLKTTQLQLTEGILELVAAGFGVAILAKWAVAPAVRAGIVRAARLGKKGYSRTWYAAVRSTEVTPTYQFDLIDMLRRHLSVGQTGRIAQQLRLS